MKMSDLKIPLLTEQVSINLISDERWYYDIITVYVEVKKGFPYLKIKLKDKLKLKCIVPL